MSLTALTPRRTFELRREGETEIVRGESRAEERRGGWRADEIEASWRKTECPKVLVVFVSDLISQGGFPY